MFEEQKCRCCSTNSIDNVSLVIIRLLFQHFSNRCMTIESVIFAIFKSEFFIMMSIGGLSFKLKYTENYIWHNI